MQGRLLLDVVVGHGPVVFELLACEDEPLLVWWDAFLLFNFLFYARYGIRTFNFNCDGLASQGLHEDLHLFQSNTIF